MLLEYHQGRIDGKSVFQHVVLTCSVICVIFHLSVS